MAAIKIQSRGLTGGKSPGGQPERAQEDAVFPGVKKRVIKKVEK